MKAKPISKAGLAIAAAATLILLAQTVSAQDFTQVATSVVKGPIPRSTFEPPAGYKKVEWTR